MSDRPDTGTPRLLDARPVTHIRSQDADAFHEIDAGGDPVCDEWAAGRWTLPPAWRAKRRRLRPCRRPDCQRARGER